MAESENIVAETAERIFADLADAQTINSDKDDHWKAPLWSALSDAGLPLSWVPEACDGAGVSLAEGFSVAQSAGKFAVAVPLVETMLAGWLLSQAGISFAIEQNDSGARASAGSHRNQRRWHAERPRARRSLWSRCRAHCRGCDVRKWLRDCACGSGCLPYRRRREHWP